jgi:hypothetical protein
MKRNIRRILALIAVVAPLALLASTANSETINLGTNPPAGNGPSGAFSTLPNGYDGFNWDGAIIDNGSYPFWITGPAAQVDQFSSTQAFDLTGLTIRNWYSEGPSGGGDYADYSTVISGYLNNVLVKSVTENYTWGLGSFSGLNIDDVNKITFKTTVNLGTFYCCPPNSGPIIIKTTGPDETFVGSLTLNSVGKAPEIDPATAVSALTLLVGGLLVLRGRRNPSSA